MGKTKGKHDRGEDEKKMILTALNFFKTRKEEIKGKLSTLNRENKTKLKKTMDDLGVQYQKPYDTTAEALGVGVRSVFQYEKQQSAGSLLPDKKGKVGRKATIVDSFTEGVIRRQILQAYADKQYLTLKSLHAKLQDDLNFPRMSRSALYNVMKKVLKFKYKKFNGKPVPFERQDIAAARHKYIREVRYYRHLGYKIFYQDESWANASISPEKGWFIPEKEVLGMGSVGMHQDPWLRGVGHRFTENLIGGVTGKPSGAGKRVIIIGLGSEDGFLEGGWKVFQGKKNNVNPDYHTEMNTEHFMEWFEDILKKIPNKSIIVLDLATYHRKITEETKNPTTGWKKQNIIDWLIKKNIPLPIACQSFSSLTKPPLLELAKKNKVENIYEVEKMIQNSGKDVKILWLPVAHCELNPIELIWSQIKRNVAQNNSTFKIADVEKLTKKAMEDTTPELWKNCVNHVIKLEELFMEKENIVDQFFEEPEIPDARRIIINLNEDSTSEEESEPSSSDSSDAEEEEDNYGDEELMDV